MLIFIKGANNYRPQGANNYRPDCRNSQLITKDGKYGEDGKDGELKMVKMGTKDDEGKDDSLFIAPY